MIWAMVKTLKVYMYSLDVIDLNGKNYSSRILRQSCSFSSNRLNNLSLDLSKCTTLKEIFKLIENKN